jgi:hypothetical protein
LPVIDRYGQFIINDDRPDPGQHAEHFCSGSECMCREEYIDLFSYTFVNKGAQSKIH